MAMKRSPNLGNPTRADVRAALHYAKKRRLARLKAGSGPSTPVPTSPYFLTDLSNSQDYNVGYNGLGNTFLMTTDFSMLNIRFEVYALGATYRVSLMEVTDMAGGNAVQAVLAEIEGVTASAIGWVEVALPSAVSLSNGKYYAIVIQRTDDTTTTPPLLRRWASAFYYTNQQVNHTYERAWRCRKLTAFTNGETNQFPTGDPHIIDWNGNVTGAP